MKFKISFSAVFISLLFFTEAYAQSEINSPDTLTELHIKNIHVTGNTKTKESTILRQLLVKTGDSIPANSLMESMNQSQLNLMNIGIFSEAFVNIEQWFDDTIVLKVLVKERWYTYPGFTLDIADRNFNTWYQEHDHDWNRLQYGIRFYQENVRGRDEDLKLIALLGFSKRFEAGYNIPFFDSMQRLGSKVNLVYTENKMLNYITSQNKEVVFEDFNQSTKRNFIAQLDFNRHPGFHYSQKLGFDFSNNHIADTISKINPDYFLNGQTAQHFFTIRFTYIMDFRDMKSYPLTGHYFEWFFAKQGLGPMDNLNMVTTTVTFNQFFKVHNRWYAAFSSRLKYSWPAHQPYNLQRGFGYQKDYVSGYELYVIDGQQFALQKINFKYRLFQTSVKTADKNIFTKGAKIPIGMFLKLYADGGYVVDEFQSHQNVLANKFLYGYGIGIDLVTFYDSSIRIEYTINREGENGLYLHMNSSF